MNKSVYALVAVVIVVAALFFSRNMFTRNQVKEAPAINAEVTKMIAHDKDVLADASTASDEDMAASLKRLSFSAREEIIPFVQKYETHSSVLVRAAAVEAAGALNDPKLTLLLKDKLDSPDELVRIAALKGLMRHQSVEHETIIRNHLNKGKLGKTELIWTYYSLARVSQDEKVRSSNVSEALKKLDADNLGGPKEGDTIELSHQIFNVFQGDKQVTDYARQVLQKSKNDDIGMHAFQFLAAYDKAWLGEKLPSLSMRQSSTYQGEVMNFIKANCPPQSEKVIQEMAPTVRLETKCSNK